MRQFSFLPCNENIFFVSGFKEKNFFLNYEVSCLVTWLWLHLSLQTRFSEIVANLWTLIWTHDHSILLFQRKWVGNFLYFQKKNMFNHFREESSQHFSLSFFISFRRMLSMRRADWAGAEENWVTVLWPKGLCSQLYPATIRSPFDLLLKCWSQMVIWYDLFWLCSKKTMMVHVVHQIGQKPVFVLLGIFQHRPFLRFVINGVCVCWKFGTDGCRSAHLRACCRGGDWSCRQMRLGRWNRRVQSFDGLAGEISHKLFFRLQKNTLVWTWM